MSFRGTLRLVFVGWMGLAVLSLAGIGGAVAQEDSNGIPEEHGPRFAGVGLVRKTKAKADRPVRYVLTDKTEKILAIVDPIPGLDLDGFVGQRVGLHGDVKEGRAAGVKIVHAEAITPLSSVKAVDAGDKSKPAANHAKIVSSTRHGAKRGSGWRRQKASGHKTVAHRQPKDKPASDPTEAESVDPSETSELEDSMPSGGVDDAAETESAADGAAAKTPTHGADTSKAAPNDADKGTSSADETPHHEHADGDSAHHEHAEDSEWIEEDGQIIEEDCEAGCLYGAEHEGDCAPCGDCGGGCKRCCGCILGGGTQWYARAEYLLWWMDGMRVPDLVTASPAGTTRANAGVLGVPGTTTLFGGGPINDSSISGGRIRFGKWFDSCQNIGLEGEYFGLGLVKTNFLRGTADNAILGRPFFNAATGQETSELVSFPGVLSGSVGVNSFTRLQSLGARMLFNVCCAPRCWENMFNPGHVCQGGTRLDFLLGYRFLRLDDRVGVIENLISRDTANPGAFLLRDGFDTRNEFNGGEFGWMWHVQRCRWSLDLLSKIALGVTRSRVNIAGSTATTQAGVTTVAPGGLLAQRTNIGTYRRDDFAVVPELGATLGYQVTPRLRALVGYSFIYWSRVARAGDQIDREVNPNLLPPEAVPLVGPLRPAFAYHYTDLWVQGVNFGIDYRW